jgi:8-oxo-dGTP pyrophosphatase MutT (NUDIX family)
MPSRTPGAEPDPAADLLGRWQAHHAGPGRTTGDGSPRGSVEQGESSTTTSAPRHAAPPSVPTTSRSTAAREVVEALGIPTPSEPTLTAPAARPAPPAPPPPRATTDVDFPPRLLARRVLGVLLLALVAATAAAGYLAYDEPTTLGVGGAGTLLVLTLVVYAVRVGSTPARLAIRGGQLEVVRGSRREVFDLTSRFTRWEVVGRPGRPGCKVLMARFGRDPLVIDSSMVDPALFTSALERHRPRSS